MSAGQKTKCELSARAKYITMMEASRVSAGAVRSAADRRDDTAGPIVDIRAAEKIFANGMRGLAPIDLTVRRGEFLTLIGPSGCGKSTLLKLIANLIQPSAGGLSWWEQDFSRVGEPGRRMAFVFQDATLMPWSRVEANVRLPLDLAKIKPEESSPRVEAALANVNLTKFRRSYPRQLSGGMRMRVSIARALVTDPDLLLMDEPFGALDEFTRNKLDDDLLRLSFERGLTTIFVTHSLYEAVFLSSRVIVMAANPGRIFGQFIVDEPEPRGDEFRTSSRFAELCRGLSQMLNEASMAGGAAH
jgi:NitT/TauT family transport system ATP-binding protein